MSDAVPIANPTITSGNEPEVAFLPRYAPSGPSWRRGCSAVSRAGRRAARARLARPARPASHASSSLLLLAYGDDFTLPAAIASRKTGNLFFAGGFSLVLPGRLSGAQVQQDGEDASRFRSSRGEAELA